MREQTAMLDEGALRLQAGLQLRLATNKGEFTPSSECGNNLLDEGAHLPARNIRGRLAARTVQDGLQ